MNDEELTQTLAKVASGDYSDEFKEDWVEHIRTLGQMEPALTSEETHRLDSAVEELEQLVDNAADRIERAAIQSDEQE